jgi:uncharacterized protein YwqG
MSESASPQDYRVYTTEFDRIIRGDELPTLFAPEREATFQKRLSEVDPPLSRWRAAAEQVAIEEAKIYAATRRRGALKDTVACLLLDHSGSLRRGQRAILATAVAEIVADYWSRIGIPYEILGFTTSSWKGGRSREKWIKSGQPRNPGRLCDLLHIVYRSADDQTSGPPRSVRNLMRDDLLKENVDGEAVAWAASRLRNRHESRKILVVVSDGAPVDDSTMMANSTTYLHYHLRKVIDSIDEAGDISLAGIGLDYDVSMYYPRALLIASTGEPARVVRFIADCTVAPEPRGASSQSDLAKGARGKLTVGRPLLAWASALRRSFQATTPPPSPFASELKKIEPSRGSAAKDRARSISTLPPAPHVAHAAPATPLPPAPTVAHRSDAERIHMFRDTPENRKIDALLERHRKPAIMLHRPYPPTTAPTVRSRLGGLPTLPAGLDWPRGSNGVPLHFMAQIDCAELPQLGPLPDEGTLFFFAREDEEMVWGEGDPADDCRVLYAPQPVLERATPAPPDLPPLKDARAAEGSYYAPDWALPGEDGPVVHYSWPLVALRIDSWPDRSALDDDVGDDYDGRVRALRAATVMAATGLPSHSEYVPDWALFPQDRGGSRFPQLGIMIDRGARRVLRQVMKDSGASDSDRALAVEEASRWVARAKEIGLAGVPSAADVDAFAAWLKQLSDELPRTSRLRQELRSIFSAALLDTIAYGAGVPEIAARIPPYFYNVLENRHLPFTQSKHGAYVACKPWKIGARHHQMLGHVPSSQDAMSVDSDTVCLLQLNTDPAIDFMFGDMGEATFWIEPGDLANRRFDKAWATMQGG